MANICPRCNHPGCAYLPDAREHCFACFEDGIRGRTGTEKAHRLVMAALNRDRARNRAVRAALAADTAMKAVGRGVPGR